MPLRRKSKGERDLAALAERVETARTDLEARRAAEQAAEAEHRQTLDALAGGLGLGNIDEQAYERGKAEADELLARARHERERAEAVERSLAARTADLAEGVWRSKIQACEADERRASEAVERAEAELVKARGDETHASARLAIAKRQALDARAGYDPAATTQAESRAERDRRRAEWFARNPSAAEEVDPWLEPLILDERARMKREDAEYRERLRQRRDYLGPAGRDGALAEGEPFPVAEVIGR